VSGVNLTGLAAELDDRLAQADDELRRRYPGEAPGRQPVHTVYVPADRYGADLVQDWGGQAREVMGRYAGTASELSDVLGLSPQLAGEVYDRVRAKLDREPIEDLRIDFEDGYGDRGDDTEDDAARGAATALAASAATGVAAPFTGIRFKSFEAPT
jgi:hypothetical protein